MASSVAGVNRLTRTSLDPNEQAAILSRPRPRALTIEHPVPGRATLRDQTSLRAHILDKVLTDMTARQWLSALNERMSSGCTRSAWTSCSTPGATTADPTTSSSSTPPERIRTRTPQAAVVELAVSGGVRDISSHVIDVYRGVA